MSVSIEILKEDGTIVPLEEIERQVIMKALEMNNSWAKTAKMLGIGRSTLYRKIETFNLQSFVAELEERNKIAREEEEERIRAALQLTYEVAELCEMLDMDKKTFLRKVSLCGFSLHRAKLKILSAQVRAGEQERLASYRAAFKKAA